MDKYEKIRFFLKNDFKNISSKELQEIMRCFSNIRNIIKKPYNETNIVLLKNKCVPLRNTLNNDFITKKLRKEIKQEYHEKLNSLLLITGIIKYEKTIPYSIEYFKLLMRENNE